MQNKLNFAFFGTPDVASETLEILKGAGYLPSLIITSPDARAGRGMKVQVSPVAKFAKKNNIECLKPESNAELLKIFSSEGKFQEVKLFIVVAYGKIVPEKILNLPENGSINIHYSLLPKYRGASPVESAILNGDTETGVTIQKMVYKMDAGAIIAQEKINIFATEHATELRGRMIKIGGELLVKTLPKIGELKETPQDESRVTTTQKIKKEDGLIDPTGDPVQNYNKFRAYSAWPRIYFFKDGKRIIITEATLENGKFVIKKILPEGKKEIVYKN